MAQIPNTKLELHPSMFDLLMTVLAYNAANAPVESVRSGAKDLMEKRLTAQRQILRKDLRRLTRRGDPTGIDEVKQNIRSLSGRLRAARKEVASSTSS